MLEEEQKFKKGYAIHLEQQESDSVNRVIQIFAITALGGLDPGANSGFQRAT